jgi:transposase
MDAKHPPIPHVTPPAVVNNSGDTATPPAPAAPVLAVGIDVSKDALDVARSDSPRVLTLANAPDDIARLVGQLAADRPAVIVVESTGGLEGPLMEALFDAGLPVARVHPGRVRHFAKGLGVLSKTDAIDARVLARFGVLAEPRLTRRRSAVEAELTALVVCRRQLTVTRAQQQNRLGATASRPARKAIEKVIATLDKQVASLDKQIRDLIDADDDFRDLDGLMRSVPGVGPTLSATLAAELREMGDADRGEVAALAGVAPFNADSGKRKGQRAIRGGRTAVRCVLYMATVAAIRCNPVIRAFSDRLRAAGKAGKVRIVACMRKLLCLLNAMKRHGLRWEELDVVRNLAIHP